MSKPDAALRRRIGVRAPLILLCLAFHTGLAAGKAATAKLGPQLVVPAVVLGGAGLVLASPVAVTAAALAAGVTVMSLRDQGPGGSDPGPLGPEVREATVSGYVRETSRSRFGLRLRIDVRSLHGRRTRAVRFPVTVYAPGDPAVLPRTATRFRVAWHPTPGGGSQGAKGVGRPVFDDPPGRRIAARKELGRRLVALDTDRHGIFRALCTGDRSQIPGWSREVLRRTGSGHIVAVSGMHLASAALLGRLLLWPFVGRAGRRGRLPGKTMLVALATIVPPLVYLGVVGVSGSAGRALACLLLLVGASVWERRPDPAAGATACLLMAAAVSPQHQPGVSLILSLLAYLGVCHGVWAGAGSVRRWVRVPLYVTLYTQPVLVWILKGIPVAAPLFSLLVVPVYGLLVIPAAVGLVLVNVFTGGFLPITAQCAGGMSDRVMDGLAALAGTSPMVPLGPAGCTLATVTAALLVAGCAVYGGGSRTLAACLAVVVVSGAGADLAAEFNRRNVMTVHFPSVGQADGVIITAAGRTVLVDCGPEPSGGAGRVARALRARGIGTIDALFLSHSHPDHVGAAGEIIRDFRVKRVLVHRSYRGTVCYPGDPPVHSLSTGSRVCVGEMVFRILGPTDPTDADGPNRRSLLLLLTWRGTRSLFTGDAGWDQVAAALHRVGVLDLLKLPHHGSGRGYDGALFLEALRSLQGHRPAATLCPSSPPGQNRLPSPQVLQSLQAAGVFPLFSGKKGGIVLEFRPVHRPGMP